MPLPSSPYSRRTDPWLDYAPYPPGDPRKPKTWAGDPNDFPGPEEPEQSEVANTTAPSGLPTPPPSVKARSTNPFAKDNLSETLLDIGSSFLSHPDNFFEGLGAVGKGLSARSQQLRNPAAKVEYGGPDNQFEIVTNHDGSRSVRQVPEFAQAIKDKRALQATPSGKDNAELRARAIYAIKQLPTEQQAAAYAQLRASPQMYGIDATGMPDQWDPTYGAIAGSMGQSVGQQNAQDFRQQQFEHRKDVDAARLAQGDRRVGILSSRAAIKPPAALKGYSRPQSRAEYNALPSGSKIIAPDGSLRIKP